MNEHEAELAAISEAGTWSLLAIGSYVVGRGRCSYDVGGPVWHPSPQIGFRVPTWVVQCDRCRAVTFVTNCQNAPVPPIMTCPHCHRLWLSAAAIGFSCN
jgi:hypothetical protein